ncbi:MAG: HAMP domain-containing protein [Candidatus Eisenbacteria bacterium]|nr:HAMP domain-containing protein [Candidatus Eisenbacteria bacterium]
MSLRNRLVITLLAMALLPTLAFTLYTRYQIGVASQWWMLPGIESALEASLDVSRSAMVRMDATALAQADRWALACPDPASAPDSLRAVRAELREAGLDLLQVYRHDAGGWRLESQFTPERVLVPQRPDLSSSLDSALSTGGLLHAGGPRMSGPAALLAGVARTADGRAVLAGYRVEPDFFDNVDRIGRGASYYRGHGLVADIQRQYAWMLAIALVLALTAVALFLSARVARGMSRPLSDLSDALGRIAAGEWSARVRPGGAREMRRLGDSFNAMAGRLEQARDALQRAEREAAWREVAQRLAHEFKNILTPMSLSIYVLSRHAESAAESEPGDVSECVGALERGVSQMSRLAEQFSQYARLPEPRFEPLDLADLARTADARSGGATRIEHRSAGRVAVVGDHLLLSRAIHNLILNACEASPPGATVEVVAGTDGERAWIEVLDRGSGVPDALRTRLFEPYVSTKHRGSGLGLALVRDIAAQHGGSVTLENRAGGGACARLELPLEIRPGKPAPEAGG